MAKQSGKHPKHHPSWAKQSITHPSRPQVSDPAVKCSCPCPLCPSLALQGVLGTGQHCRTAWAQIWPKHCQLPWAVSWSHPGCDEHSCPSLGLLGAPQQHFHKHQSPDTQSSLPGSAALVLKPRLGQTPPSPDWEETSAQCAGAQLPVSVALVELPFFLWKTIIFMFHPVFTLFIEWFNPSSQVCPHSPAGSVVSLCWKPGPGQRWALSDGSSLGLEKFLLLGEIKKSKPEISLRDRAGRAHNPDVLVFISQECSTHNQGQTLLKTLQSQLFTKFYGNLIYRHEREMWLLDNHIAVNNEFCFQSEMSVMFSTEAITASTGIHSTFQKLPRRGWW